MNKRLFISIPLSPDFKGVLGQYHNQYTQKGIRWLSQDQFHLTICFLGDTDASKVPQISENLQSLVSQTSPFQLTFKEVTFAPPGKSRRMVWAVFDASDAFTKLVTAVSALFAEVSDSREPIPHVTMARIKYPKKVKEVSLVQPRLEKKVLDVKSLDLQESGLSPRGASYNIIRTFPFRKIAP